ncbi:MULTISPECIES: hypothetical protein [Pseudomonas]|uniref:Type III secretion system effector HopBF1-like domain-containing protein n=1 Tax=Pseudomonas kribbensis TaxID=1628086 RepID=A0A4Y8VK59_9PSED|nr:MULTISPECIES: hypothetical protein [Pseudomonas]TFH80884.1 hypothetical protein E4J90_11525 [Pseudomonas kribbensis]
MKLLAAAGIIAVAPEVLAFLGELTTSTASACAANPVLCVNQAGIFTADLGLSEALPVGVGAAAGGLTAKELSDLRFLMEIEAKTGAKLTAEEVLAVVRPEATVSKSTDVVAGSNIGRADLGDLLGRGGNKDVYGYGDNQAVGVLRNGTNSQAISDEINMLGKLHDSGIPTVNPKAVSVDGTPGMLMDQFAQGSKDVVRLMDGKVRIVGDSPLLNQQSISDLKGIRDKLVNNNIQINDLQFLISNEGRVVVADPLAVNFNATPSKNNLRMIDLLIQAAQKNGPFK